jgi:hypothetical protein
MSNIQELRMQRWERIQKAGMIRFILIRGLSFGLLFGIAILIIPPSSNHRLPAWYILVPVFCLAGLAWGSGMWFVTMGEYNRAKRSQNRNPN